VEEINSLLSKSLSDYIKENNIKILGDPLPDHAKAENIDWDAQKDFEFYYNIGMVEDFAYDLSSKIKIQANVIEVDQKVLDETVADLKKRFGKVSYPETTEAGDSIYGELTSAEGDFKKEHAFIAIEKLEKTEQKKFVGAAKDQEVSFNIAKAFKDVTLTAQLLGKSEEEAKEAKGTYTFKISSITRTEDAAVDQELFDRVFGKDVVTSEQAFLDKIKETISENYKRESDHFLDHNIEDHFIKNTSINLPEDFLKTWLKETSEGKITDEVLAIEFADYKRGLIWDLVKNKIAEDNKITVEADEVRAKAKDMIVAQFGGQAFAEQLADRLDGIADNYLQSENGQNFMRLYNQLRAEKILAHIKQNITIKEKKVSLDDFKKIVAEHTH
jgi:trigger factor